MLRWSLGILGMVTVVQSKGPNGTLVQLSCMRGRVTMKERVVGRASSWASGRRREMLCWSFIFVVTTYVARQKRSELFEGELEESVYRVDVSWSVDHMSRAAFEVTEVQ